MMTRREVFGELLVAARGAYDDREAQAVAEFVMERVFGVSRVDMALEPAIEVVVERLEGVLEDIANGRPAQYIAGEAWFDGGWMAVREGVLVPRPETEELVRWMTEELAVGARVLDVGTGSGAIATALARRGMRVTAVDISDDALDVARENARRAGVEIEFVKCDILHEIPAGEFDAVASNPPYIPRSAGASMHRNVCSYEPPEALFVPDDDPLIFYKAIARTGVERLYFEIYEHFAHDVCGVLESYETEVRRDINGRERMVRALKK